MPPVGPGTARCFVHTYRPIITSFFDEPEALRRKTARGAGTHVSVTSEPSQTVSQTFMPTTPSCATSSSQLYQWKSRDGGFPRLTDQPDVKSNVWSRAPLSARRMLECLAGAAGNLDLRAHSLAIWLVRSPLVVRRHDYSQTRLHPCLSGSATAAHPVCGVRTRQLDHKRSTPQLPVALRGSRGTVARKVKHSIVHDHGLGP